LGLDEKFRVNVTNDEILLSSGTKIPVERVRVEFNVNDAKTLGSWSNGSSAITLKEYGRGKVLCIGGSVSAWSRKASGTAVSEAWESLLALADLENTVTSLIHGSWPGLESRLMIGSDVEYLFIVNHVEKSGEIIIPKDFDSLDLEIIAGENVIGNVVMVNAGGIICYKLKRQRK
jgi:hypothetical protein